MAPQNVLYYGDNLDVLREQVARDILCAGADYPLLMIR